MSFDRQVLPAVAQQVAPMEQQFESFAHPPPILAQEFLTKRLLLARIIFGKALEFAGKSLAGSFWASRPCDEHSYGDRRSRTLSKRAGGSGWRAAAREDTLTTCDQAEVSPDSNPSWKIIEVCCRRIRMRER